MALLASQVKPLDKNPVKLDKSSNLTLVRGLLYDFRTLNWNEIEQEFGDFKIMNQELTTTNS